MKIAKRIKEGEMRPFLYGVAYRDLCAWDKICYPIPFNLLCRAGRYVLYQIARWRPLKQDRIYRQVWEAGRRQGIREGEGNAYRRKARYAR